MKHVKSQLTAYAGGLLTPKQSNRVQAHLQICADCRDALAHHKQIARDLRLALTVSPRPDQIARWWGAVQSAHLGVPLPIRRQWWVPTAMLPSLLVVFVIVLPMLVGLTGQVSRTAMAAGTYSAPAAVVTNVPPTDHGFLTQEPPEAKTASVLVMTYTSPPLVDEASTAVSVNVTPAPLAP
jgi:anti-sigma factor RsiW